jgi:hypothetical protein
MTLEEAGVEREPAAVAGLHLGRDDHMAVDLRVIRARRGLTEHRHRQTIRVGVQPTVQGADPRRGPVVLEVSERRTHRSVVRLEQTAVLGECPQCAQRLRGGEGRVESGDRVHNRSVGADAISEQPTKRRPRCGVTAFEQRVEIVATHIAGQLQRSRLLPDPHAGRLARRLREVLRVVRRGRRCRRRIDRRHPQHGRPLCHWALVCSFVDGRFRESIGRAPISRE